MSELFQVERRLRRKRFILRLKIYGAIALVLLLLIGLVYLFGYSPIFKIKNISVKEIPALASASDALVSWGSSSGNQEDFDKSLEDSVKYFIFDNSKLSKFVGADNILLWNNDVLDQKDFLKAHPEISQLVLKKNIYKREIEIDAEKRNRLGIWCNMNQVGSDASSTNMDSGTSTSVLNLPAAAQSNQSGNQFYAGSCFWFDDHGVIFDQAPDVEGNLIYKVNDYTDRNLKLGDNILSAKFLTNLMKIFQIMDKSDLKNKSFDLKNLDLEEIQTEPVRASGTLIYFSLKEDPSFAESFLESINRLGLQNSQYIDLRVPDRVYYK